MPIQVLATQLANQIAAGEVVERPASVVKELVENSLDAGATRIDIEIEKGGIGLMCIRDNGRGIPKDELVLALARHATSKIATLNDLEAISTLGFRGEALASISSVSRLTLTSRPPEQQEAWQVYAEGRDMQAIVKPAAHPPGTTLQVLDLFYNTPARRKFMRTEKTEFMHIDEVVRRIALARFDVAFSLSHNGKLIRQYRAVNDDAQRLRRLGAICGTPFMEHALRIDWRHGDLNLQGWIADALSARQISDLQYFYVNGRMVRDRLINHAIRQAYQNTLPETNQPAFVLYLTIDPHQLDVNVHPAKHEVRFHQSRLVHDFIYQGAISVLEKTRTDRQPALTTESAFTYASVENRPAAGKNLFSTPEKKKIAGGPLAQRGRCQEPAWQPQEGILYQKLMKTPDSVLADTAKVPEQAPLRAHCQSFGRVLTIVQQDCALLENEDGLVLIALPVAMRWLKEAQLQPKESPLKAQPLLIPLRLKLGPSERDALCKWQALFLQLGVDVQVEKQHVMLKAVPFPLRQQNLQKLFPELAAYLVDKKEMSTAQIVQWLVAHMAQTSWNHSQAIALLADLERLRPDLLRAPPAELLQKVTIDNALKALRHD